MREALQVSRPVGADYIEYVESREHLLRGVHVLSHNGVQSDLK
jgi:hypothetical protein